MLSGCVSRRVPSVSNENSLRFRIQNSFLPVPRQQLNVEFVALVTVFRRFLSSRAMFDYREPETEHFTVFQSAKDEEEILKKL